MLNKVQTKRKMTKTNKMMNSKNSKHKIPSRMMMRMNRQTKNKFKLTKKPKKTSKTKKRPHHLLAKSKTRKNTAKVFYSSFLFTVVSSLQSSS